MDQSLPTRRRWKRVGIGLALCVVLLSIAGACIDDPLRGYIERPVNQSLDGYRLTIGSLDFHPVGFSIDLENVVLVQTQQPDQPILKIPLWSASVHWRDLLRGALVSDHRFERPSVRVTRAQAAEEAGDDWALKERGWQEALLERYPLEINALEITDGDVTDIDSSNSKPLRWQAIQFHAENIRNIESADHVYPSEIKLSAQVFDSGRLTVEGKADFLAEPHLGVDANVTLAHVALKDLLPLAGRMNLQVRDGILDAKGHVK
ncbi:MAG: DUF748 domain-containing protein [Nitrospira defluvii]|nr:DUF748 domain-containing protein [Nitrospira defluvii]